MIVFYTLTLPIWDNQIVSPKTSINQIQLKYVQKSKLPERNSKMACNRIIIARYSHSAALLPFVGQASPVFPKLSKTNHEE